MIVFTSLLMEIFFQPEKKSMPDLQSLEAKLDSFMADQRQAISEIKEKLEALMEMVSELRPGAVGGIRNDAVGPGGGNVQELMGNPMFQDQDKNVGG
jgi:hypothetical protein